MKPPPAAHLLVYNGRIMEGFADRNVTIKHHHCEEETEQLCYAASKGDGSPLNKQVCDQLWGCDRGIADVYEGQEAQEEIHRGVQTLTALYGDNDEQISQYDKYIEK